MLLVWRAFLLLGWRLALLGWRPSLLGWRPFLLGCVLPQEQLEARVFNVVQAAVLIVCEVSSWFYGPARVI